MCSPGTRVNRPVLEHREMVRSRRTQIQYMYTLCWLWANTAPDGDRQHIYGHFPRCRSEALGNHCTAAKYIFAFQRDNHLSYFRALLIYTRKWCGSLTFLDSGHLSLLSFYPADYEKSGLWTSYSVLWLWLTYIEWGVFLLYMIINVGHS